MVEISSIPMEELLPHRQPMILVDRMVEADKDLGVCEVEIRSESLFMEKRGVPAFAGVEYMAQTIAAQGGYLSYRVGRPIEIGFLLGAPRFKTLHPYFKKGQILVVRVLRTWGEAELMRFHCKITDKESGNTIQEAELNVFKPKDLERYLKGSGK